MLIYERVIPIDEEWIDERQEVARVRMVEE